MKNSILKTEEYVKPEVQVVEMKFEGSILSASDPSADPNSVGIDDMGGWNMWDNE